MMNINGFAVVEVFVNEDLVSLDKEFCDEIGQKFTTYKKWAIMEMDSYHALFGMKLIDFDYEYHDKFLENMEYEKADQYFYDNCKGVIFHHWAISLFDNLESLFEYAKDEEIV